MNFAEREQYGAAFLAINPKSKVPALQRDDGSVLTEFQAISIYLALTHPERRLIPSDPEGVARMIEAMDYCVGTIHAVGFRRLFRPGEFAARESDHAAVEARGSEIVKAGFALIDKALANKDWVVATFRSPILRSSTPPTGPKPASTSNCPPISADITSA